MKVLVDLANDEFADFALNYKNEPLGWLTMYQVLCGESVEKETVEAYEDGKCFELFFPINEDTTIDYILFHQGNSFSAIPTWETDEEYAKIPDFDVPYQAIENLLSKIAEKIAEINGGPVIVNGIER